MPDGGSLAVFLVAAFVLAATPGPAVLYIVTRSAGQGRLAGLVSCLGIATGGAVHVAGAALGLSAILASSALAFSAIKYAGAAYLLWLGFRKLTGRPDADTRAPRRDALGRVFWEGAVVNVLNPKTALFLLAFLPQFADPSAGSVPVQLALLGTLFLVVALSTDAAWGLLAGGAAAWLHSRPRLVRSERYVTGGVYVGLGLAAAFSGQGRR